MDPSPRQIKVLAALAERGGRMDSDALAERLHLSRSQVTITINALVGHGAVSVVPAGNAVTVALTSQGRRIHERATEAGQP